jgi:hypothetical protein
MHDSIRLAVHIRVIAFSSFVIIAALSACVVLSALSLRTVTRVHEKVAAASENGDGLSTATTTTTSSSSPLSNTGYRCDIPLAYRSLSSAPTWILLGDEFAAGHGASNPTQTSYAAALLEMARHAGSAAANTNIINAATQHTDDLHAQVQALRASSAFASAMQSHEPVLVLVSYGAQWLQQGGGASASLSRLYAQFASALFNGSDALAPAATTTTTTTQVSIILIAPPNPFANGVLVPAELTQCSVGELNHPTVDAYATQRNIYDSVRIMMRSIATRQGYAFVDTDTALAQYAWPTATGRSSSAFADCRLYNDMGQALLAELLWSCFSRRPYVPPVP